ncbi:MAG: hypothetical protein QOF78_3401 [Phycisphaerales bacterium]|nr:hypothetical protein [Phycisphaerales bacterium]
MDTSPPFTPAKRRVHRKRHVGAGSPTPTPPVALVLVSAGYVDVDGTLTLGFDRAIDISGLAGNQITVDDQPLGVRWVASGAATLISPMTVRIEMIEDGGIPDGDDVLMNASAASGIVAVDDSGTWGGATNLLVPFP